MKKIAGENLIVGKTYYMEREGINKGVYEGEITIYGMVRCLFTPVGETEYLLYFDNDYDGEYVGKYSITIWGDFFEKTV